MRAPESRRTPEWQVEDLLQLSMGTCCCLSNSLSIAVSNMVVTAVVPKMASASVVVARHYDKDIASC